MGDVIRLTPHVWHRRQYVDVERGGEIATMLLLHIRKVRGNATALRVALGMATAAVSILKHEVEKARR
jgi:hypothetical protein